MFDVGWMEMVVIGTVALVVVGPKDLPGMFRSTGQFMAKARGMARDFQRTMEQAANEAGLGDVTKVMTSLNKVGLDSATSAARDYAKSVAMGQPKPKGAVTRPVVPAVQPVAAVPVAAVTKPAIKRKAIAASKRETAAKTAKTPRKKANIE